MIIHVIVSHSPIYTVRLTNCITWAQISVFTLDASSRFHHIVVRSILANVTDICQAFVSYDQNELIQLPDGQ